MINTYMIQLCDHRSSFYLHNNPNYGKLIIFDDFFKVVIIEEVISRKKQKSNWLDLM